eukprot:gene41562-51482_t
MPDHVTHDPWTSDHSPLVPLESAILPITLLPETSLVEPDPTEPHISEANSALFDIPSTGGISGDVPTAVVLPKVSDTLPPLVKVRFEALLQTFEKVFVRDFSGPPWTSHLHEIRLKPDAHPRGRAPFRLPQAHLAVLQATLDKWLEEGVITPSESPWAAPAFFVPKPDGSLRLVIDYRYLNSHTIPDRFPLPLPEELLGRLHGAELFSSFDAHSGFTQQAMHPNSRYLTAFTTPMGLFQFTRLSMGLRNGPASFSRGMSFMSHDLEGMLVYLDDVNIYTDRDKTDPSDEALYNKHYQAVLRFLQRCSDTNLRLNGKKCFIGESEIKFLGHWVSSDGIRPDAGKVKAVETMATPRNTTDVRAFLGLVGYYRTFIKDMALLQLPLNKLLLKGTEWNWTNECELAFQALKKSLTTDCIRRYPDPTRPFEVHTDASDYAIGAVLVQRNKDGIEQPLEYFSRSLSPAEINYTVTEKECLAIVAAALASLLTMKDPTRRIARWLITLGEYPFVAVYRKGCLNGDAD